MLTDSVFIDDSMDLSMDDLSGDRGGEDQVYSLTVP